MSMARNKPLIIAFMLLAPALVFGGDFTGKVVGVVDGDSIRVMHDGKAEQIRLNGIDCPEKGRHSVRERNRSLHRWCLVRM